MQYITSQYYHYTELAERAESRIASLQQEQLDALVACTLMSNADIRTILGRTAWEIVPLLDQVRADLRRYEEIIQARWQDMRELGLIECGRVIERYRR